MESLWSFVVALSVVVGLASGGYFFFRPTLEIVPPAPIPIDANGIFSSPFIIKNNSVWFSVLDVRTTCHVIRLWRYTGNSQIVETNTDVRILPQIQTLEAGEEHSVPCYSGFNAPQAVRLAEVALVLDYKRPWFYFGIQ
jgi:hypothetical protein